MYVRNMVDILYEDVQKDGMKLMVIDKHLCF